MRISIESTGHRWARISTSPGLALNDCSLSKEPETVTMTDSSAAEDAADDDETTVPFSTGSVRDVCTMVTRLCRALMPFLLLFLLETESFFDDPALSGGGRISSAIIITAVFTGEDLVEDEPPVGSASRAAVVRLVTATEDGGEVTETTLTRSGRRRLERSAAPVALGCCVTTRSAGWTVGASVESRGVVVVGAVVSWSEEWER